MGNGRMLEPGRVAARTVLAALGAARLLLDSGKVELDGRRLGAEDLAACETWEFGQGVSV